MKRARDVAFVGRADAAPPSIVLTTLAAYHYNGEETIGASRYQRDASTHRRIHRWATRAPVHVAFVRFISDLNRSWQDLLADARDAQCCRATAGNYLGAVGEVGY